MSIHVKILDGTGGSKSLKVTEEGAVPVVVHGHPSLTESIVPIPIREYFVDSVNSNDMRINGLITNTEFSVVASPNYDIYIKTISLNIEDDGAPSLLKFGALPQLANGVKWTYSTIKTGEIVLHEGLLNNRDFIRIGLSTGAVGDGVNSWLSDNQGGASSKSYLPIIDLSQTFGTPWGVRLVKGSNDKITFTIKDNLTTLIAFDAIAYGIRL